ncbi:MAG TPA: hypothetical protein VFV66_01890 [Nonomuraea sp.]|nr:hypothetical protein [Nonomuraea sp.]
MTRLRRFLPLLACVLLGCAILALFGPGGPLRRDEPPPVARTPYDPAAYVGLAQEHLRRHPGDAATWASLGHAYLEQGRASGDTAYHGKAQGAFERALRLSPGEADALIGMGALANARHDFAGALRWAGRVRAAAPYRWPLYGVLTDAYLELGDYARAEDSLRRMLNGRPDLASFTRVARVEHLRGHNDRARRALVRALEIAANPAEQAFCLWQLGDLAWSEGDLGTAVDSHTRALAADPGQAPSLAGRARALAALGRTGEARRDYAAAVARAPAYAAEYGELLDHLGDRAGAKRQYAVFAAQEKLLAAGGAGDDLAMGRFEADHGRPAAAVRRLRAEWKRRQSVDVADALGWALHRAGRHREAAAYARRAGRLGGRNALFAYHRGEIERALGHDAAARALLAEALSVNPHFSPSAAARARALLAAEPHPSATDHPGGPGPSATRRPRALSLTESTRPT